MHYYLVEVDTNSMGLEQVEVVVENQVEEVLEAVAVEA